MGNLYSILLRVSKILSYIGAVALTFMMLLTVADVILRAGGRPILGTYEIVAFSLAIVIGFTIPQVSLDRGHVFMEIVLDKVSKRSKTILNTFTRLLCIILFV
ncbi:MAG: TRAP transporter small permease, partial [Thermodesulfobacteriota bacterium]